MKKLIKMMMAAFALVSCAARAGEFKAVSVGPLMNSLWDQNWPYTNFTPVNRSTHQHMPNGCVAVALSQVMHFWDWPTRIDDTWFGANFADGVPGFEQQMLAGTEIDWASMRDDCVASGAGPMTYADYLTLGKGQILTSIVVEMKFKKQAAGADASRFAKNPWFMRTTEMNNVEGGLDAPPYSERYARVRTALTNGIPLLCTIDVGTIGHEIVVDGWRETNETDGEVHVNYGWGTLNNEWRPFSTCGVKSFMFGFVPRPMVIPTPLDTRSALPVPVRWHFPKKGYEKLLKGFALSYAEATDETEVWQDGFETQQGTFWGELMTREIVAECGEDSTVLRIDNDSDRSTYTWPAKLLGAEAVLSFRYRSDRAKNQSVLVEAYDASHGWRTLESLALNEAGASEWKVRTISLSDYAGKATAIRFRTERAGVGADKIVGAPQFGVQIDDVRITNVRKLHPAKTLWVDAETRACALNGDVLEVGKTYVISISPDLPNGEAGYGVATTIVENPSAKAGIVGVKSVGTTSYQFQSGVYRPCYIGTNQFAVYTTAATTKLRASLSHPSLIDVILVEDVSAAVPGTMVLSPSSVSLANAVKIVNGGVGKWLVTLCFDSLTEASQNAQEIVTLEAEDADGNIARKEIYVCLVQKGNETPVKPSDIPAYTGTDESVEGSLPPIVETKCTVRFDANGGSGTTDVVFDNGDTIVFPDVSRAGYTLDGWYTKASGGDSVEAVTRVINGAIYYAHWTKRSSDDEPQEPGNVCIVTFDADTVVVEREVAIGGEVGPLPNDLVKDGYTLEGWYTDSSYTEKVKADRIVNENVTFYAHWVESTGGGDAPSGGDEPTGQNDFTEGGKTYRFCDGVNKTGGFKDVSRNGTSSYKTPGAYNLVLWWADAYKTANGDYPTGYSAPSTNPVQSDFADFDLMTFASGLFASAVSAVYPNAADRAVYFPATSYTAAEWQDDTSGDAAVKAAGRRIFTELINGPIGIMVQTSLNRTYGAVIWGCEYEEDGDGKYATVIYFTSPRVNNNDLESATLSMVTVSGVDTQPGLKGFNTSAGGLIQTYYPIVGPAGKHDDKTTAKTYTIVFDSDGGTSFNARSVVEGGTINPLPQPTKSGFTFDGWFCGDEELKTDTEITAGKTYKAKWTAISSPTIEGDPDAQVAGDAASGFTVTPGKEKKIVEVTIPTGVAASKVTVRVGPDVEKITPHGAMVKIVKNGHDITDYLDVPEEDGNGAIDLTKATVKAEIMKEPLDAEKGAEVTLEPSKVQIQTANTRPGLTYTLKEGASILDMKAGDSKIGDGQPWSPSITVKGGASGFYAIVVEK